MGFVRERLGNWESKVLVLLHQRGQRVQFVAFGLAHYGRFFALALRESLRATRGVGCSASWASRSIRSSAALAILPRASSQAA